jgi:hypothetical protein
VDAAQGEGGVHFFYAKGCIIPYPDCRWQDLTTQFRRVKFDADKRDLEFAIR